MWIYIGITLFFCGFCYWVGYMDGAEGRRLKKGWREVRKYMNENESEIREVRVGI